jgi:predicted nucleic acid-binding Zn ribbon protein
MRRYSQHEKSPDGDKPVDDVDNSVTQSGPDLARAALEAAKQAAKARGRAPAPRGAAPRQGGRRRTGWSGARADDRDPQQLGRLASRIAAERGWVGNLSGGAVFGRWAELVGADVAEHAQPVSLRESELTVQATSTAWATQLRLLQHELLRKIAAGVGRGVVKRLRIHGPAAPSWRHGHRHVPGRGPRDTYG